jgi:hypothetical protein
VERVLQFGNEIAGRRTIHEGLGGIHQSSETGEPNRTMGPQTLPVEACNPVEGVETAPMGVAGSVAQLLQLAEHGERDLRAQSALQIRQSGNFLYPEHAQKRIVGEEGESHNVIVPFYASRQHLTTTQ